MSRAELSVRPVRADDAGRQALDRFSAAHGTFRWCSCQRWRMTSAEFRASDVPGRVKALADEAQGGGPVGVLAFADDEPVGWCSVAPRACYRALARSRVLAPVDDVPVWSLVCFYVPGAWRRRGVTGTLLRGALAYAREEGAAVVEAYPAGGRSRQGEPAVGNGSYSHMGPRGLFEREGFVDVTPPGRKRSVLRHDLRA
ncbi:GNAT family N-acetyltransferase [Streptacidiphilus anmyonensis]|uniref:GNAT family N-acetyltransferase n=1 Tax=Streptacidiphilus anmyonensis TaxID=405782 RepID=UPI0006948ED7|nr:GNAT family N-acetyltransferase [Streptacidiphilus anmyonensis]